MIPFKGRSPLKQYLRNKSHRWGFKVFARAGVSGMIYDFVVYARKSRNLGGEFGILGNVVLRLVQNLNSQDNFKVYFDNWFNSIDLIRSLKIRNIWAVGTIRAYRLKGCELMSEKNLKQKGRGEFDYKSDRNVGIIVVRWHDNIAINLVSSYCDIAPTDKCNRWSFTTKEKVEIVRPHIVKECNHHMGGVDLCDMLMELYRSSIRSKKWYMRILYYCIDVAVTNG